MFDTGTYANHKNNKTGAEVLHTSEKGGRLFSFLLFYFTNIKKKTKTKHLYYVCLRTIRQSDTLTLGDQISYSGYLYLPIYYANETVQRKTKKKSNH